MRIGLRFMLLWACLGPTVSIAEEAGNTTAAVARLYEQIGRNERILSAVAELQSMEPNEKLQIYLKTAETSASLYRRNVATLQTWADDLVRSGATRNEKGRETLKSIAGLPEVGPSVQRALDGTQPGESRAEAVKAVALLEKSPFPDYEVIAQAVLALRHHPDLAKEHREFLRQVATGKDQNPQHRLWALEALFRSSDADYLLDKYSSFDAQGRELMLRQLTIIAQASNYQGMYATEAQAEKMFGILSKEARQTEDLRKQQFAVMLLKAFTIPGTVTELKNKAVQLLEVVANQQTPNAALARRILAERNMQ